VSFAETYLKRYASGSVGILPPPDPDLAFIVVIPVYNEPDIHKTILSIILSDDCQLTGEIIIVLNKPEGSDDKIFASNNAIRSAELSFQKLAEKTRWTVHLIEPPDFLKKKAGPGLARKIGMDESIRRFNKLNRPDGIVISMDADTTVASDYFLNLKLLIQQYSRLNTYTCYFEHPIDHADQSVSEKQAIIEYEIYLRLVKIGLFRSGFPQSIHSLGSAFGVRALAYVKAGGMGVQQSGEDFYFLHKCIQLGDFYEANKIKVYPSSRPSDRVIFGTGPFVNEFSNCESDNYEKYSWKAFADLKRFIFSLDELPYPFEGYESEFSDNQELSDMFRLLDWHNKIILASSRSGNQLSFVKWLWREIDGFQMVRFLNEHQKAFGSQAVSESASLLLHELGVDISIENKEGILEALREFELSLGNYQVY
jgi:hypothetical protein